MSQYYAKDSDLTTPKQWRMQDFFKGGFVIQSHMKFLEATPTFD